MNDSGLPGPDWAAVFDRAHRRIASRLLLLGAFGALGALLLLGGGLSAQGAISLRAGSTPHKAKDKATKDKPDTTRTQQDKKADQGDAKHPPADKPEKPDTAGPSTVAPTVCVDETDASGHQYCERGTGGGGTSSPSGGSGGTSAEEGIEAAGEAGGN